MATYYPPSARMNQIIRNAQRIPPHDPNEGVEVPATPQEPEVVVEAVFTPETPPDFVEVAVEIPAVEIPAVEIPVVEVPEVASLIDEEISPLVALYSEDMRKSELLSVAVDLGVEIPRFSTKAEILQLLDAATKKV